MPTPEVQRPSSVPAPKVEVQKPQTPEKARQENMEREEALAKLTESAKGMLEENEEAMEQTLQELNVIEQGTERVDHQSDIPKDWEVSRKKDLNTMKPQ